jgi:hypothetical protein
VPSGFIHPRHAIYYSLEGALDELTIHGRALDAAGIAAAFSAVKAPPGMSSPWAVMPAGAPGPGRFGAYYETLQFQDTWDRPRRIGPRSDVVVRFPQSGMRLVFWQGLNYVPAWVTENARWYTDARAVVHWRYALSESENYKGAYPDPLTGRFDWGDEYWTIYPDGVAVRKQVLWSSHPDGHEFQESIVLNGPGQWPEDNIQLDAVTMANLKGETSVYSWKEKPKDVFDRPHGPDSFPSPADANIQWINLKSTCKPFQIAPLPARFTAYNGEKTLSSFEWWNHWPVAQIDSSGRPALAPDRASHTSLSHIDWPPAEATESKVTKLLMDGLTAGSAADLVPLAKSWLNPAAIEATGLRSEGYQAAERAYVLRREGGAGRARITLRATAESPIVNPALIVRNWSGGARVRVNGKPGARIGQIHRLEETNLVVWIEIESRQTVRIEIEP